jgi:hypothetical protein
LLKKRLDRAWARYPNPFREEKVGLKLFERALRDAEKVDVRLS